MAPAKPPRFRDGMAWNGVCMARFAIRQVGSLPSLLALSAIVTPLDRRRRSNMICFLRLSRGAEAAGAAAPFWPLALVAHFFEGGLLRRDVGGLFRGGGTARLLANSRN